jgi:Tol biopolymer transport system component
MKRLVCPALAVVLGASAALVPASAEAAPRRTSAIVFVSDQDHRPPGEVVDDVYLYDTRTGRTSNLTDDREAEAFPSLSPDGRYLAYEIGSTIVLCRVKPSGPGWTCGSPRGLVSYPPSTGGNFVWTPDGTSIVYAGQTAEEPDFDLYRIDVEGFAPAVNLTDEAPGSPDVLDIQPTVTPDGRFVVYSSGSDLWRRRIDGSHPVQLTNTPAPTNEFGAAVSPDGKLLAFHSNRKAPSNPGTDGFDVYVMKVRPESGSNVPVDVTPGLTAPGGGPSRERFPSFSPDGKRLAFWWSYVPAGSTNVNAQDDLDSGEIYTVRTDGTDPVNLTNNNAPDPAVAGAGDIQPDWGRVRR